MALKDRGKDSLDDWTHEPGSAGRRGLLPRPPKSVTKRIAAVNSFIWIIGKANGAMENDEL